MAAESTAQLPAPASPQEIPRSATPRPKLDVRKLSGRRLDAEVKALLLDRQYDELDAIVAELNEKRWCYSDGIWRLARFFDGVSYPRNFNDPDGWKELFQRLEEWDRHSHSVFSGNAVGATKVMFAWEAVAHARGRVPTEGEQKELASTLASAAETYDRVLRNPQKCVDVYAQLIRLGQLQRWPEDKMLATLREALSIAPDYQTCFVRFAVHTLPMWGGKEGDTRRFFDSIPTLVPEDKANEVYTRLGVTMQRYYQGEFFGKNGIVEWQPMKMGFERLCREYPKTALLKNEFAAFAVLAGDRPTARTLLDEITAARDIEYDAWLPAGGFETAKKWIMESP